LKQELIHPHRNAWLVGLRFSPDGRQIIAGDYPDGLVEIWDVLSGKLLTSIESGYAFRGSAQYLNVSSDWRTLYVSKEKRKYERVQEANKDLLRWQFDGEVRAWDLRNGQLQKTFKHQPARNIRSMQLSPDGARFVTWEEVPGTYELRPKQAASLWNVQTGQYLSLPDGSNASLVFSPDGKTLAGAINDENGHAHAVKLFDVATGQDKLSIPIQDKFASVFGLTISPDGRLLVACDDVYENPKKWDNWRSWLKCWDTVTGREVASFPGAPQSTFGYSQFSPDGQTLAVFYGQGDEKRILLFRVADRKQIKAIDLGKPKGGERSITGKPAFSADGKWLAVMSFTVPITKPGGQLDVRDASQPRIYLVDVAAGKVRETLISPHTFGRDACFSPDGRLLATSGQGRVLLWDVTNLGGGAAKAPERPD